VAELVSQGSTNQQVADQMFVSMHTVAFHLRQIFRKLGIRREPPRRPRREWPPWRTACWSCPAESLHPGVALDVGQAVHAAGGLSQQFKGKT
jgi:Bacterial regulatory proteins, luxR family